MPESKLPSEWMSVFYTARKRKNEIKRNLWTHQIIMQTEDNTSSHSGFSLVLKVEEDEEGDITKFRKTKGGGDVANRIKQNPIVFGSVPRAAQFLVLIM